jgi:D-alanyl-lipoteichoic acid acyltransferase DltB (MBOAT superfamily)
MLFNSPQFALFFALSAILFFAVPQRLRWIFLLAASYYFYMSWKIQFGAILLGCTLVTYLAALRMSRLAEPSAKKKYVWVCVAATVGTLFLLKYYNFFSRSLNDLLQTWNVAGQAPILNLLLPVGISFYFFQSLGYVIDVYRGRIPAESHLGRYALFVAFWPQLLAGPIGRAPQLLPQLRQPPRFDDTRVVEGLRLMLWGLFKKAVVADTLAGYVNTVYGRLDDYHGLPLMIAAFFYTVQIYCDFSGYTDVARGAARVMGVDLMENFTRPYFARSLREFWQGWHISLSTWFRDYVYIPLGGRRVAQWRWYYNLFITFLLSGLWHGANWTFAVWGAMHGCFLILEYVTNGYQRRLADSVCRDPKSPWSGLIQVGLTLVLVCLAWVFFRAPGIADALRIITGMFRLAAAPSAVAVVGWRVFVLLWGLIAIVLLADLKERRERIYTFVGRLPRWARWSLYTLTLWAVGIASVFNVRQEFIYFQF